MLENEAAQSLFLCLCFHSYVSFSSSHRYPSVTHPYIHAPNHRPSFVIITTLCPSPPPWQCPPLPSPVSSSSQTNLALTQSLSPWIPSPPSPSIEFHPFPLKWWLELISTGPMDSMDDAIDSEEDSMWSSRWRWDWEWEVGKFLLLYYLFITCSTGSCMGFQWIDGETQNNHVLSFISWKIVGDNTMMLLI